MPPSLRRLLGAFGVVVFLFLYILAVLNLRMLLPDNMFIDIIYYLIFGILWVWPALIITKWSHRTTQQQ
jgi:L-asparagine transporter-like permease